MSEVHQRLQEVPDLPATQEQTTLGIAPSKAPFEKPRSPLKAHAFKIFLGCLIVLAGVFAARPYLKSNPDKSATTAQNNPAPAVETTDSASLATVPGLLESARAGEAIAILEKALKTSPEDTTLLIHLALAHRTNQDYARAHDILTQVISLNPLEPVAHNNRGLLFAREKKFPEAITSYNQALELQSDYPEAHFNLATAYEHSQDWTRAISHYETYLKLQGDDRSHQELSLRLKARLRKLQSFHAYASQHGGER